MDWHIGASLIHGRGVIADRKFSPGEYIEEAICIDDSGRTYVTPYFGAYVNHSYNPNGQLEYNNKSWYMKAIKNILPSEEITANYNHTPYFISKPQPGWK